MGGPLTLGTGFRRAQKMGLGESKFGEEPKVDVMESVYIPDPRANSIRSDNDLLLSGNGRNPMET